MRNVLLSLISGAVGALAVLLLVPGDPAPPAPPPVPTPAALPADLPDLAPQEEKVIALFESARLSVVSITTETRVTNPFTRRTRQVPQGTGSGFVWDAAGHIVTNNHVIEGATAAQVGLADGRVFPARLVGRDPSHDLAVLRIEADDPPPALPLGRSAGIRVGQSVLAIGNPFGLDWTLTTGVVSALDRELNEGRGPVIRGLIQTDAAINPGNSGGPLIDSEGRLIGVNTAIYSPSGSSAGIGFAVPVDTVARVVPQLIETGRFTPAWLGVVTDPRADPLARQAGLPGVLVLAVEPGSPAQAAGLRPLRRAADGRFLPGDTITALNGHPVGTAADLDAALDLLDPGARVTLEIERGGVRQTLDLTLG